MIFKINIGTKEGNTYKLEAEAEELVGKSLHDKIQGQDISPDLSGYEFEIAGASDKSGFTLMKNVEGIGLKKILLTYGKAMKKKPRKEGKKKRSKNRPKGLRLRKTVRGKIISPAIVQINLKILKQGDKKLVEIFPEQNKKPVQEIKSPTSPKQSEDSSTKPEIKPEEQTQKEIPKQEEKPVEEKVEQTPKEEIKQEEKKPEDIEVKEEGAKQQEKKEEKELAQPDKEPTQEKTE